MIFQAKSFTKLLALAAVCFSMAAIVHAGTTPPSTSPSTLRSTPDEIRHQILMEPYYGVFDWIDAEIRSDDSVVLHGQVRNDLAKPEAEARIRKIAGVTKVVNEIQVLPLSPTDDQIRIATYRALFRYDSTLFRYANSELPSIHIVVDNGRVTLKGMVGDSDDRQLAYVAARNVSGVFEVTNELGVDPAMKPAK